MKPLPKRLIDPFQRQVDYVRLSVTDRCDFRCVYCMAEEMQFLPRSQVLTLEEIARLGKCFSELGVHKLRLTGAELAQLPAGALVRSRDYGAFVHAVVDEGAFGDHVDALFGNPQDTLNVSRR